MLNLDVTGPAGNVFQFRCHRQKQPVSHKFDLIISVTFSGIETQRVKSVSQACFHSVYNSLLPFYVFYHLKCK